MPTIEDAHAHELVVAKVTSKGQVTLPKAVREALGVTPGDRIVFAIEGNAVCVQRYEPLDLAYLQALETSLEEWAGPEDEEAYRDL